MNHIEQLKGGLIVSCQAAEDEPLHGSVFMQKMAQAAIEGGAVGLRANGVDDIVAIRKITSLPIIGINKVASEGSDVYITPTFEDVVKLFDAGATIVALDATSRKRADGTTGCDLIKRVKKRLNVLIMADISTFEEGEAAYKAGADFVGTTLSGYTAYTKGKFEPDFDLIEQLARKLPVPIIAEGRIWTPEEAVKAYKSGAFSVVVGTAITRPQEITKRFVNYIRKNI
ncbi:N-acetylmannosamine-6-phosphate 2-epimerase [Aneurinibacillus terranovensis]|uniref:N-acetylmannosamine-6-phosphate 2-epimerase n=1 Tax=Aneurinibacillus terranovensis TaxID=278991 RepID=UPI0003FDA074|nr:N-acetylmannosamine-6-phosphate 2-epimerase [Aneurinibacillus terranovensis]